MDALKNAGEEKIETKKQSNLSNETIESSIISDHQHSKHEQKKSHRVLPGLVFE